VLLVPRVLEPELCKTLIDVYENGQPSASGFMRTENGKTVGKLDPNFKRRNDVTIEDSALRNVLVQRIHARLVPEIRKSFQFSVNRIERYIVACYSAEDAGFFRAHRDNTTAATAHRRFAATINLNAEDHDGGELRFPEFGPRRYKAPTGGAIVFSCSLLHEALPVTRGLRYATLPFLYDDEAAAIRAANLHLLDGEQPQRSDGASEPAGEAAQADADAEY
jgi:predicted 2-oxoglutarate/Fe(II)-dependent dioxygenase YbiX